MTLESYVRRSQIVGPERCPAWHPGSEHRNLVNGSVCVPMFQLQQGHRCCNLKKFRRGVRGVDYVVVHF